LQPGVHEVAGRAWNELAQRHSGVVRGVPAGKGSAGRVDGRAEVVEHLGDEYEDRGVELREGGVA
jgi:hypothetical protein